MSDARDAWQAGPFDTPRPIAIEGGAATFRCPVAGTDIAWAAKDMFNPGAVVRDGRVCLLVRGEDREGRYAGTSRIGLATSDDGVTFTLEPQPVLAPGDDRWQAWEWPGGIEDPRVVEAPDGGGYVCTYTAFDGKVGCLFVATSPDLRSWTKHGPAFAGSPYVRRPSKSGAIVTTIAHGRLVAARIGGRFWMYWGEGTIFAAQSDDLVAWTPVDAESAPDRYLLWAPGEGFGPDSAWQIHQVPGPSGLLPVAAPRPRRFDSLLAEPGPPAIVTPDGILLIYNGANHWQDGADDLPALAYRPAQLLLDGQDPRAVIGRATRPFTATIAADALAGQVGNVCFAQGLVIHDGRLRLYLGLGDSRIGTATAPLPPAWGGC